PDQRGECGIELVVVRANRIEHLLAVEAGMLVALPRVDRVAAGVQFMPLHGLAEGEVGEAAMGPELDENPWAQRPDQPERERGMLVPGGLRPQPPRPPEARGGEAGSQQRLRLIVCGFHRCIHYRIALN